MKFVFRPPGTLVPEGLMFYPWCFFLFYSFRQALPGYLRAPSADRSETLPHDLNLGALYNASPKIGALLQTNWGQKHAKLGAISDNFKLRSRISPERVKASKIGKRTDRERFFLRSTKKSGELWSSNYRVLDVSLDPPKLHFSGDYISALRGCWPLKFLHAPEINQGLLAYTLNGDGVPQKI